MNEASTNTTHKPKQIRVKKFFEIVNTFSSVRVLILSKYKTESRVSLQRMVRNAMMRLLHTDKEEQLSVDDRLASFKYRQYLQYFIESAFHIALDAYTSEIDPDYEGVSEEVTPYQIVNSDDGSTSRKRRRRTSSACSSCSSASASSSSSSSAMVPAAKRMRHGSETSSQQRKREIVLTKQFHQLLSASNVAKLLLMMYNDLRETKFKTKYVRTINAFIKADKNYLLKNMEERRLYEFLHKRQKRAPKMTHISNQFEMLEHLSMKVFPYKTLADLKQASITINQNEREAFEKLLECWNDDESPHERFIKLKLFIFARLFENKETC